MTKKFIEHIPLLTAILIYYAYCNLFYYYQEFKIEIYNYISNSELVLSFLPTIVIITAAFGTYITSYVIGSSSSDKQRREKSSEERSNGIERSKSFFKKPLGVFLILLFISCVFFGINRYMLTLHNNKAYELRDWYLYTSPITILSAYLILKAVGGTQVFSDYSVIISIGLIIFIGEQIGKYRKFEANAIKDGKNTINLLFKYNDDKILKTNKNLIFIGQTQSTLFLYNATDSSTLIINKNSIDSLVIK